MRNSDIGHRHLALLVKQRGFASLLIVLLTGLSLTAIAMGAMYSIRGAQGSQIALHAQTQAEIKIAAGVQALTSLLQNQTISTVSGISSGTVAPSTGSSVTFAATGTCPSSGSVVSPNYCFDLTASSGGAYSTVRTTYNMAATLGSSALAGSVFAGGLQVGGSATLQGSGPTVYLQTGGQYAGYVVNNSNQQITLPDITTTTYHHTQFVQPSDLRPYSNYIYYLSGSTVVCKKNNLPGITSETPCSSAETNYLSYDSNKALWTITANNLTTTTVNGTTYKVLTASNTPPGVIWVDGNVVINYSSTLNILANTIIATGSIDASLASSANYQIYLYAPSFYANSTYSANSGATLDSPEFTCGASNYPTQLCTSSGSFQPPSQFPASLANILFLSGNNLTLGGSNNGASNFYGDIINSTGSGGTGSSSGKFTGTGTINIVGNIVNSNENSVTQLNGNITVTLADTTAGGSFIPTYQYLAKLIYMQYR